MGKQQPMRLLVNNEGRVARAQIVCVLDQLAKPLKTVVRQLTSACTRAAHESLGETCEPCQVQIESVDRGGRCSLVARNESRTAILLLRGRHRLGAAHRVVFREYLGICVCCCGCHVRSIDHRPPLPQPRCRYWRGVASWAYSNDYLQLVRKEVPEQPGDRPGGRRQLPVQPGFRLS